MKFKAITFSALFLAIGFSGISQELPEVSSSATVQQRVGLTDIEVSYSRPNVNEREIFGELVPFDKIWRLGANAATKFTTSSEIQFNGAGVLPAGEYALFATPGKGSWMLHFNKNHKQWGAYGYKAEEDALQIKVPIAQASHFEESMSIRFENVTTTSGMLVIEWSKTRVEVPFTVPTKKIAIANIDAAIKKGEDLATVYSNAAEYYSEQLNDNKKAMEYVEKSLALKESIAGYFTKAQILKEMGDLKGAIASAEKAEKIAKDQEKGGWAGYIRKTINEWSK